MFDSIVVLVSNLDRALREATRDSDSRFDLREVRAASNWLDVHKVSDAVLRSWESDINLPSHVFVLPGIDSMHEYWLDLDMGNHRAVLTDSIRKPIVPIRGYVVESGEPIPELREKHNRGRNEAPLLDVHRRSTLNTLVHQYVFGGSVEPTTALEVLAAMRNWQRKHHPPNFREWRSIWNERCGKPYQVELEAHVAAYRSHIPDYVGDASWLAKGMQAVACREVYIELVTSDAGVGDISATYYRDGKKYTFNHAEPAMAFWNAAIRACGYGDEG